MKLIVGLGNPGAKYARNRHNVGFLAVDRMAEAHRLGPWKKKFQGLASDGDIAGEKVLLLKPETYMNDSGRAVGEAARFHKIALGDIVVLHDELDLAPGKIKVKTGGGSAGHNGLRSITQHLGADFVRVRIGIGHPGAKELVHGWVLSDFAKADARWLDELLDAMAKAAGRLATGDNERFMTDVALALRPAPAPPRPAGAGPGTGKAAAPEPDPRSPAPAAKAGGRTGHPTGERQSKRASALAENLKRWLAGRQPKD